MQQVRIEASELWVPDAEGHRLDFSRFDPLEHHVHGRLDIVVNGRTLPGLGFFGANDVCLDAWVAQLLEIRKVLAHADQCRHVYDEGEQGQPAFEFLREGADLLVSVIEGIGGGTADRKWHHVRCSWADFSEAIDRFLQLLEADVRKQASDAGAKWLSRVRGERAA